MNVPSRSTERVICLIDMDCFYVQVEEIAAPEFRGKPCGVCQYNPYRGGGLIAVNYEARKFGVKRGMRGEEAKSLCPEFHTFYVKEKRGKADLTKYREASLKIFEILTKHSSNVEKASIDEAYIDLTDLVLERIHSKSMQNVNLVDSFVSGSFSLEDPNDAEKNLKAWIEINSDLTRECNDVMLLIGAAIVQEIRQDIENTLGYHCSAGIAQNKTLAKLCCGLNKPNKQTILPPNSVESLLEKIPINKIKNLGGKLGMILNEELGLNTVGDLAQKSLNDLVKSFGEKTGNWLHQISHGIDLEPVMSRQAAKSIGCSKNFRGKLVLNTVNKVEHWVRQLCEELEERLESDRKTNNREPTLLVIQITNEAGTFSKSTSLTKQFASHFISQSMESLNCFNKSKVKDQWYPGIYTLGISTTKFVDLDKSKSSNLIDKYFSVNKNKSDVEKENEIQPCSSSNLKDMQDDDILFENSNSVDNSLTESNSNKTEEKLSKDIIQQEPSTSSSASNEMSKSSNKSDIRNLFKKQTEKSKKGDESDLDADELSDSENIIVLNEEEETKVEELPKKLNDKPPENIKDFFKKNSNKNNEEIEYDNLDEDIDYVLCKQCNKKILCWNMPEHEDFHFAQMISRQQASESTSQNKNTNTNSKKRLAEETPNKVEKKENQKLTDKGSKGNKKLKTELGNSLKSSVKSIDNYFKKPN